MCVPLASWPSLLLRPEDVTLSSPFEGRAVDKALVGVDCPLLNMAFRVSSLIPSKENHLLAPCVSWVTFCILAATGSAATTGSDAPGFNNWGSVVEPAASEPAVAQSCLRTELPDDEGCEMGGVGKE